MAGRRRLLVLAGLWCIGCLPSLAAEPLPGTDSAQPLTRLIREAGESESDAVRLLRLRVLDQQARAARVTLPGLDRLILFVERWQSPRTRLNFFRREVLETLDFDFGVPAESPLRPIADFYLARMICWVTLEYSEIYPVPEKRARALGRARELFSSAQRAFPANRITGMYLGRPLPPEKEYLVPPRAPRWAVAQREGLERLTDIIEWWIEHRLRVGGDYGGGWGDDCELWRSWTPILIGFSHPRIAWAQELFSRRLLEQPHLVNGYHAERLDVEHGAEDVSDALTPMMFLAPDEPDWARRIHRLVDLSEGLWMGRNQRGQLQFKSAYFSATEVDPRPERACDTVYHPRVLQPALLYWQRTGDERIGRLVTDWMRTWVDAAARAEKGKPAGILPSALHWPDGNVGGTGPDWWLPGIYETSLYDFPGAMGLLLNTLVLTAHMTGDATYLEPLRTMAEARRAWLQAGRPLATPGTRLWCGANVGQLAGAAAKVRFSAGNREWDDLLRGEDEPYVHFRLGAPLDSTVQALEVLAETLRVNFPAFTSEVRFTDRMLRFPALYQPGWMLPEGVPTGGALLEGGLVRRGFNGVHLLYHTVTGDPGDPLYFPQNAVRWHTEPRDLAALVIRAEPRRLEARLYHFGPEARRFEAEWLTLAPGEYRLEVRPLDEGEGGVQELRLRVSAKERRTVIHLPSRRECQLIVHALP